MSQKQGLEIYKADGTLLFDLTTRIPKYFGEVDIYPTSTSSGCSGEITIPSVLYTFPNTFCILKKVYASNLSMSGYRVVHILPSVSVSSGRLRWRYSNYSSSYTQYNLPVRVCYGCF